MKNPLVMELYSTLPLTAETGHRQINALSVFCDGVMRPDKCDIAEPIRGLFNPDDYREPVGWLSRPLGAFMYQKGKPAHVLGWIRNYMPAEISITDDSGVRILPARQRSHFVNVWTSYFDGLWVNEVGLAVVQDFVSRMFCVSEAEFGLLTAEKDLLAKNYLVVQDGQVTSKRFVGRDPENGIPGLYWMNLFGPRLTAWLGIEKLLSNSGAVERIGNGTTRLQFGESPDTCRSPDILARQKSMIELLGREKFFDIGGPNRVLATPFVRAGDGRIQ